MSAASLEFSIGESDHFFGECLEVREQGRSIPLRMALELVIGIVVLTLITWIMSIFVEGAAVVSI